MVVGSGVIFIFANYLPSEIASVLKETTQYKLLILISYLVALYIVWLLNFIHKYFLLHFWNVVFPRLVIHYIFD